MGETPSSAMFDDLRRFGGISHRSAAGTLISKDVTYGGKPLTLRLDDKTFLSREVVHAQPGKLPPELFGDFVDSAKTLTARLISAQGGGKNGCVEVVAHYRGQAAQAMEDALATCGIDRVPYANAVQRIMSLDLDADGDRALLLVMLFVATGCLADPSAAADRVDLLATSELSASLGTLVSSGAPEDPSPDTEALPQLGLVRLVGGAFRPPIHQLSGAPGGTVIGCLPVGPSTIADVDQDVSRMHVRIWRDGAHWYAMDLGSTNGTRIISGADKSIHTIGHGTQQGAPDARQTPETFEIRNSDIICLGATTRFLVMKLSS